MEEKPKLNHDSRWDCAGFISKIFCLWIYPLFLHGWSKDIQINDIDKCPKSCESEVSTPLLEICWQQELKKNQPLFARALLKAFRWKIVPCLVIFAFNECILKISQPLLLGYIIRFFAFENKSIGYIEACVAAGCLCLSVFLFVASHYSIALVAMKLGMEMRIAACTLLYKKALRLNNSSMKKTAVGQIINVMSNDVYRFDPLVYFLGYIFVTPIQTILISYILWQYLHLSTLSGLAIILLYFPFQAVMGKLFSRVRAKTAKLTDKRVRLMDEIISGIRVIKMYAWEKSFADLIAKSRKYEKHRTFNCIAEISQIRLGSFLKGFNLTAYFATSKVVIFACFVAFVLSGGHLTSETVFVVMSLIAVLQLSLMHLFAEGVQFIAEAWISCRRIQNLLLLPEVQQTNQIKSDMENQVSIKVENLCASWDKQDEPVLKNISVELRNGELLIVIGPVGCGKSSFLMSLLGELQCQSGQVSMNGSIAYASQVASCFNGSVRENILFGRPFNQNKYDDVVRMSALEKDFKLFSHGDKTLVGEKGVSLSSGQNARITLARALYTDADVYLLDDPLSVVDSTVARHIFDYAIKGYLANNTRILITHQMQFVKEADKILVLKDGECLAFGSYEEIINNGVDLRNILPVSKINFQNNEITSIDSESEIISEMELESSEPRITEEEKVNGVVANSVYWHYFKAGNNISLLLLAVLSAITSQVLFHYFDFYLADWTHEEDLLHNSLIPAGETQSSNQSFVQSCKKVDRSHKSLLFTGLIVSLWLLVLIRAQSFFAICMKSSVNLHNSIFFSVLRVSVEFFDSIPVGRVLNRFTKDIGIIDDVLPETAFSVQLCLLTTIGILIVVAIVEPFLIFPAIVLVILLVIVRRIYIKTARSIKRFESITRSPIYSHISNTLSDLVTIRAFKAEERFVKQYCIYQNDHSGCCFLYYAACRALGIVCDLMSLIYITTVVVVIMVFYEEFTASEVGLAISSALLMARQVQYVCRQTGELENEMVSVERVFEYSKLKPEGELETQINKRPKSSWPEKGAIRFSNVTLIYNKSSKAALENVSFTIEKSEKIGIIGRTGSGKSSLLASLFRIVETSGIIEIDGINTKSIGLHDLRRKISINPQDPVIFSGSIRSNLDPFNEKSESDLWQVLKEVQLEETVNGLEEKLDAVVAEGGTNFSVGQRQLICLARAILKRNKILVIDEATANVDQYTDSLIQSTIRRKFADCTVLTIAHRLNTIIDCDRIMVLDEGSIVEFNQPHVLLQNPDSLFKRMLEKTGKEMSYELMRAINSTSENVLVD